MNAVDPLITVVNNWLTLYDNAPKGAGTSTTMLCEPARNVLGRPVMTVDDAKLTDLAHCVARVVTPIDDLAFSARVTAMRAALEATTGTTSSVSLLAAARAYLKAYDDSVDSREVSRTQLRCASARVPSSAEVPLRKAAFNVIIFDVGSRDAFEKVVERLRDEVKAVEVQVMRGSGTEVAKADRVTRRAKSIFDYSRHVPGSTFTPLGLSRVAIEATVKAILEHIAADRPEPTAEPAAEAPKPPAIKVGDQVRRAIWGDLWTVHEIISGRFAELRAGNLARATESLHNLETVWRAPESLDTEGAAEAKLLRDFGLTACHPTSVLATLSKIARIVKVVKDRSIASLTEEEYVTWDAFTALAKETP